jgi:hypothetical protein
MDLDSLSGNGKSSRNHAGGKRVCAAFEAWLLAPH